MSECVCVCVCFGVVCLCVCLCVRVCVAAGVIVSVSVLMRPVLLLLYRLLLCSYYVTKTPAMPSSQAWA